MNNKKSNSSRQVAFNCLAILLGGFIGGILRDALIRWEPRGAFPWSLVFINVFGTMCMAACLPILGHVRARPWLQLAMTTGLIGAMTTFASLVADAVTLFASHPLPSIVLVTVSIASSLIGFWFVQFSIEKFVNWRASPNLSRSSR